MWDRNISPSRPALLYPSSLFFCFAATAAAASLSPKCWVCLVLLFVITSHVPLVVASICQTNRTQAASLSRLRSDAIVLFVILDDGICHLYLLQTACFMSSFVAQTNLQRWWCCEVAAAAAAAAAFRKDETSRRRSAASANCWAALPPLAFIRCSVCQVLSVMRASRNIKALQYFAPIPY